jgi:hypothetical protein
MTPTHRDGEAGKPSFWHRLMHKLGLTSGFVDHEKDADGIWWIGLRCAGCGKLMHPIKSNFQDEPK